MSDDSEQPPEDPADAGATRRGLLMLGAVSASMVVTIRPALAQAAGSIMNCQIPVPDPKYNGTYISQDGKLVAPNQPGAFPPSPRPFTGEQVKTALRGNTLPGTSYQQSQAYTNYIRRLQRGMSGFTCYASLQRPR